MFPNGHKVRPLVGVTFWTLWLANTYGVLVIGQLISFITRHKWAKHLFKNLNRPWCTLNRPWRTLLLTHQTSLNIKPIIPYTLEAAKFAASKYHLFIVYILLVCILIDVFFFFFSMATLRGSTIGCGPRPRMFSFLKILYCSNTFSVWVSNICLM